MFSAATNAGYSVVSVDEDSDDMFVEESRSLGVHIFRQAKSGVGNARRQSIAAAKTFAADGDFIVLLEPEKTSMIPHLKSLHALADEQDDLVLFWRNSLDSYPREQILCYSFGRLLSEYLLNRQLDLFFGPHAIRRTALQFYEQYAGEHDDKWDAIHVPKYRALTSGKVSWRQLAIDYVHPIDQVSAEIGNLDLFKKRLEQAHRLSEALIQEHQKTRGRDVPPAKF